MCGILGYTGVRMAMPILLEGLHRLEYRGYDSAGVAVMGSEGRLEVHKHQGKLSRLVQALNGHLPAGTAGVGHTRWATHGVPSDQNAHPHLDCSGRLVSVHNGIIENFLPLRERLQQRGHRFRSQTDSEVIAHLVEESYDRLRQSGQPAEEAFPAAVRRALSQLQGSYAVVLACSDCPTVLVGARRHSPLVVGLGEGENFLASDVAALLAHTRRALIVGEEEVVTVRPEGVRVHGPDGRPVDRQPIVVPWDPVQAEKGGYEHFYLKEIHEQPEALSNALAGRIVGDSLRLPELEGLDLERIRRIYLAACGSSYHAALVGQRLLEAWAGLPAQAWVASELRYAEPLLGPDCLLVAVTQSGETADTLACYRMALEAGSQTLCITNVLGSSITWDAHAALFLQAGPEVGVVASKTYTAQLALLAAAAARLGEMRGRLPSEARDQVPKALRSLPRLVSQALEGEEDCARLARAQAQRRSLFYFGRGLGYPVALEGALKLKEISYIHAEGYPAGELKHGPIAMLDEGIPVMAIATRGPTYQKLLSNVQEVRARRAPVLAVATRGDAAVGQLAQEVLYVPDCHPAIMPIVATVPLQLFAYYVAVERGCDVDQPRNLAKSVTVE